MNTEPGKMALSALLLIFGLMIILAGLQLGGLGIVAALPGALVIVAVVDDTLIRNLRRYRKQRV